MFGLILSLLINTAEARPAHVHRSPHSHQVVQHRHRPMAHQHAPRVGFRFVWNGLIWLELPLSHRGVVWVPAHFGRYGYWVQGHYKTV